MTKMYKLCFKMILRSFCYYLCNNSKKYYRTCKMPSIMMKEVQREEARKVAQADAPAAAY